MDLRTLKYFVSTVEVGSISGAAHVCHVAQPSITLAIAKLEQELNCKLLIRRTKGCITTPEGQKMYRMAKDLLAHAQSIRNEFELTKPIRRLTLKVDPNIRVAVLEAFINSLNDNPIKTMLSLVSNDDSRGQSADLHLTVRTAVKENEVFFPLMKERYALLIPKSNQLAFKSELYLDDLQEAPLITRIHCENKALFEQVCVALKLNFQEVAEVETEEWAHSLVGAGLGLCFAALPYTFQDERFEIRPLDSLFKQAIPEREIGLSFQANEQTRMEALIPHLFK